MRRLGLLAAALVAAAVVVPFAPARAAAAPTCQGERATIVETSKGEPCLDAQDVRGCELP